MEVTDPHRAGGPRRSVFFLAFFMAEAAVFAILPLSARWPVSLLLPIHAGLTAALLATALLLRQNDRGRDYWPTAYALFAAGTAVLLSTLFSARLPDLFDLAPGSLPWVAVAKGSESLWRVVPILLLMAVVGGDRRSMYLGRGRLGLGLGVGLAGFAAFSVLAFLTVPDTADLLRRLPALSPWILLFVLSNGFTEELLFRGLFLRRCEPFLGKGLSNLLTAMVFTGLHVQATYVSDLLQFLVILFPLSLVWGYLTQKTDSLWGSAIFHAGADCMVIFGICTAT